MTLHELKQNLHSNRHTLIPYGIPVIVYSLAYFLIIAPFLNRSSEIDFIEADRIRSVEKYRTVLKHEKYYRKDIERSEIALKKTDAKLHPIGAGEQLVQEVLAKAKSGKVSITSLEAGAVIKGAAFDELSLKIKAEGSFKELLTFFRALETATPSFNLSSLSMTADDKGILRSDFIVKAMVRHEETK